MTASATSERKAVGALLTAAQIDRIILVDDAFAIGLEEFVNLAVGFGSHERAALLGEHAPVDLPDQVFEDRLRALWASRDAGGRVALIDHAYAIDGALPNLVPEALSVLADLLPTGSFEKMTLKEWQEKRGKIISELATRPTLILFDNDFSHEEGGRADEGPKLIRALEADLKALDPPVPFAFYGLLTNHAGVSDEHEVREAIASAHDVDRARFVLISKQNLGPDTHRFVGRLRTVLSAPMFAELMSRVADEVTTAQKEAAFKASSLPPEDLEQMIIDGPEEEGSWPPETALRIVQIYQRSKAEQKLRTNPDVVRLNRGLRSMADVVVQDPTEPEPEPAEVQPTRAADAEPEKTLAVLEPEPPSEPPSEIGVATPASGDSAFQLGPIPPTPMATRLAHSECYDSGEHINGLHLPVELGDVFESESKSYIVVTQPCELMVRSSGRRMPELTHIVLAEVQTAKPAPPDDEGSGPPDRFATFEMPWYDAHTGASRFVNFNRRVVARASILDLCVLNVDGRSQIMPEAEADVALLPHWRARQAELAKQSRQVLKRWKAVHKQLDLNALQYVAGWSKGDPFKPDVDVDGGRLSWNCARVRRLREPYARALLIRSSQYFARDAFLRDLTPRR